MIPSWGGMRSPASARPWGVFYRTRCASESGKAGPNDTHGCGALTSLLHAGVPALLRHRVSGRLTDGQPSPDTVRRAPPSPPKQTSTGTTARPTGDSVHYMQLGWNPHWETNLSVSPSHACHRPVLSLDPRRECGTHGTRGMELRHVGLGGGGQAQGWRRPGPRGCGCHTPGHGVSPQMETPRPDTPGEGVNHI